MVMMMMMMTGWGKLPLIVSYLLGRVDAFARDGRRKKTIAFSGTPHRHRRHRCHTVCIICIHYISCCPAHLTRFPQECFQSAAALLFVTANIIFAGSVCVCVCCVLKLHGRCYSWCNKRDVAAVERSAKETRQRIFIL